MLAAVLAGAALTSAVLILALFYFVEKAGAPAYITGLDKQAANILLLARSQYDLPTKIFFVLTLLGNWQIVLAFTIIILTPLWIAKKKKYIIPFLISIIGSEFFNFLSKLIFQRQRPEAAAYDEISFSFPSGHATIAISFYGFIAYILWRKAATTKQKNYIIFLSVILMLVIGLSRLYLGVHFISDVIAGYLVGLFWLAVGIYVLRYLERKR